MILFRKLIIKIKVEIKCQNSGRFSVHPTFAIEGKCPRLNGVVKYFQRTLLKPNSNGHTYCHITSLILFIAVNKDK